MSWDRDDSFDLVDRYLRNNLPDEAYNRVCRRLEDLYEIPAKNQAAVAVLVAAGYSWDGREWSGP